MIRHVVLFQFADDTTVEQIDDYEQSLVDYVATLEGVESYGIGRDARINPGTYDFSIVAEFTDEAAFRALLRRRTAQGDPAQFGFDDRRPRRHRSRASDPRQRTSRAHSRTSSTKVSGTSNAAKWPPLS